MMTMLEVSYAEKDLAKAAGARWNREASFWFAPANADLEKLEKWIITVLDVPFAQKDKAKAAGARWNADLKLWYAPAGADLAKLDAWLPGKDRTVSGPDLDTKHAVLDVPYKEKDLAKQAGARWNSKQLVWYAPQGANLEQLNKWIPTPARAQEILDAASKKRAELASSAKKGSDGPKQTSGLARALDVPFKEKDLAKAAGARWDGNLKVWVVPEGLDLAPFERWKRSESTLDLNQPTNSAPVDAQAPESTSNPHDLSAAALTASRLRESAAPDAPAVLESKTLQDLGIRPNTLNASMFRDRWFQADPEKILFPMTGLLSPTTPTADLKTPIEEIGPKHEVLPAENPDRSFWRSAVPADLRQVVVVERAIDALSYHQILPDEHTLFLSTGGGPLSPSQKTELAEGAILGLQPHHPGDTVRTNPDLVVIAAFSNSKIGAQLARELKEALPPGLKYERNGPTHNRRHWNDTLQLKERDTLGLDHVKNKSKGLRRSR
jgi:hypothetical protein